MKIAYYAVLIIPLVILLLSIVGLLFRTKGVKYDADSPLTPPPAIPEPTPTIVINGIVIGEATYSSVFEPDLCVTVISVNGNVVEFQDHIAKTFSLPVDEFLVLYAPRKTTKLTEK